MRGRRSKKGLVLVMIWGKALNWTWALQLIFSLFFTLHALISGVQWVGFDLRRKPLVTVLYDLHEYEHDLA
jgi:hypothetical protein